MQTISIGPLEFHTAKNITEKLSELNVNHEVIRVGDQLLGDQVETLISNPQRTMLSIELGKTDFESHQQFFRSYGIEILPESSGEMELEGYRPTRPYSYPSQPLSDWDLIEMAIWFLGFVLIVVVLLLLRKYGDVVPKEVQDVFSVIEALLKVLF